MFWKICVKVLTSKAAMAILSILGDELVKRTDTDLDDKVWAPVKKVINA